MSNTSFIMNLSCFFKDSNDAMSFMRRSYTYGGCLIENNKYMIDSD